MFVLRNKSIASLIKISLLSAFLIFSLIESIKTQKPTGKIDKNILVNVFPGGKSHNFVLKDLFDYTLEHDKEFEYKYHVLVHNWDKDAWPKDGPYKVYGYGDMSLYDKIFNEALDLVRKDPIFGYGKFNKAMVHIYEQFFESGVLDQLRKTKYDTLITDIPNFLTKFLKMELEIKNNVYCSPPSLPNLFYKLFEMNPSYLPAMGSTFHDVMTFTERFQNHIYMWGMKFFFSLYAGEQADTFNRYGYDLKGIDFLPHDSFVMLQYPPGFFFNISLPPIF